MSDAFTFLLHLCCSNVSDFSTEFNLYTFFSCSWNLSSSFLCWVWLTVDQNHHHAHPHIALQIPPGISWPVYWLTLFSQSRHTEPQIWKPLGSLRGMLQTRQKPTFVDCDDLEGPQIFCCFFTWVSLFHKSKVKNF